MQTTWPRMATFCQKLTSSTRTEGISLASPNWDLSRAKRKLSVALTLPVQHTTRWSTITSSPSPSVLHWGAPATQHTTSPARGSAAVPQHVLLFIWMFHVSLPVTRHSFISSCWAKLAFSLHCYSGLSWNIGPPDDFIQVLYSSAGVINVAFQ